jgi:hypothetical protein
VAQQIDLEVAVLARLAERTDLAIAKSMDTNTVTVLLKSAAPAGRPVGILRMAGILAISSSRRDERAGAGPAARQSGKRPIAASLFRHSAALTVAVNLSYRSD